MRTLLRAVAATFAAALLAATAEATVVLRASVEELAEKSDRVVLARVVGTRTEQDAGDGSVWTVHRLRLEESWIGAGAADVEVSVPGGTAGGVTQESHGVARLAADSRVAVFLWRDDTGRLQVLGEAQGSFAVARDAATGDETCSNSVAGLALVDRSGKRAEAEPTVLPLSRLRSRVAAAREVRETRERAARDARDRRFEIRRARAARLVVLLRGRPGAPVE